MNHPCMLLISAVSILAASFPARADLLLDRGPGLVAAGNINNWSTSPKNIGWAYSYDAANQVWWMAADSFSLAGQPGATGYRIDSIDLWIGSYATINELNNGAEMRLAGGMANGTGLTWLQVGAQLTLDHMYHSQNSLSMNERQRQIAKPHVGYSLEFSRCDLA